jgi:hypothetical protein
MRRPARDSPLPARLWAILADHARLAGLVKPFGTAQFPTLGRRVGKGKTPSTIHVPAVTHKKSATYRRGLNVQDCLPIRAAQTSPWFSFCS